uniref:Uncharacterized protein n=1 Tax=Tetranychus urticae TaxID=32264 RepID=T1JSX8_TETUR
MLSIDASTSVFDLRVEDDTGTVYTEKEVTLKNSSHLVKLSFVLMGFACLSKTYCISSDGFGVCSKNNLVTAQFKVIPVFGEYDYLQLTLKGYNLRSDEEKTIKVSIEKSAILPSVYTCYKSPLGSTYARFDREPVSLITGSSYYTESILSCSWTFNIDDPVWPSYLDLITYTTESITLYNDSRKVIVAQDTSQLPIYHAQYLKCCNKVHGDDNFLLTFDQNENQIRYRLYYWQYHGKKVTLILTRRDGIKLQFECDTRVDGHIINGTERVSIAQQLIQPEVIYSEICSWATPLVLGNSSTSIDASTTVFDLQVQFDSTTVYTVKGVTLTNSSHLVKLSFFLMAFSVMFHFALT